MGKVFREVVGLWLAVDFTEVERGRLPPPYVDHDRIDFNEIGAFIAEHFRCGETVRIRMANDTIDQVTIHFRMPTGREDLIRCDDFAKALFEKGIGEKPVVDVRAAWRPLHHLKDRTHAPPPMLLMFIVEGGFEAVQLWLMHAGTRLGIRAANPMALMAANMRLGTPETGSMTMPGDLATRAEDHEGKLTPEFARKLERWFGVKYQLFCQLLPTVGRSELPDWAQKTHHEG